MSMETKKKTDNQRLATASRTLIFKMRAIYTTYVKLSALYEYLKFGDTMGVILRELSHEVAVDSNSRRKEYYFTLDDGDDIIGTIHMPITVYPCDVQWDEARIKKLRQRLQRALSEVDRLEAFCESTKDRKPPTSDKKEIVKLILTMIWENFINYAHTEYSTIKGLVDVAAEGYPLERVLKIVDKVSW